jgi:hypothetical protein
LDVLSNPLRSLDLCRVIQLAVEERENPSLIKTVTPPTTNAQDTETKSVANNNGVADDQQLLQEQSVKQPLSKKRAATQQKASNAHVKTNAVKNTMVHPLSPPSPLLSVNNFSSDNMSIMSDLYQSYGNPNTALTVAGTQHVSASHDKTTIPANQQGRHFFSNPYYAYSGNSHNNTVESQRPPQEHRSFLHEHRSNLTNSNLMMNQQQTHGSTNDTVPPVLSNSKQEELLRWKECIRIYSEELGITMSAMAQPALALVSSIRNDSISASSHRSGYAENKHSQSQIHQTQTQTQSRLSFFDMNQHYDQRQHVTSGPMSMSNHWGHQGHAVYYQTPQVAQNNTSIRQQYNHHSHHHFSSGDEGGSSGSSSSEDFGGSSNSSYFHADSKKNHNNNNGSQRSHHALSSSVTSTHSQPKSRNKRPAPEN